MSNLGPLPLGPLGWAARAQLAGQGRGYVPPPPPPARSGEEPDDPDSMIADELAQLRKERRADEYREAIEDAKDRREIRRLERQKTVRRLQREIAFGDDDLGPRSGGGNERSDAEVLIERLSGQWENERRELTQRLDQVTAQLTKADQDGMRATLAEIKAQLAQPITQKDPLEQLVGLFTLGRQVREGIDQLMPAPPAPPPIDPGLTHQQILDREKVQLEHDILLLDRQAALETVKLRRDEILREKEEKTERWGAIAQGAQQVAGALTQALAPTIAGMLPAGIGGGHAPAAHGMSEPGLVPPGPPMPAGMITILCPNSRCRRPNSVPAGTGVTRCEHCGTGPIYLQPNGAPAPPGLVTSI